jgi:hypothetical protein
MAESCNGGMNVPPEVLEWLGIEYYNEKNFQAAENIWALGKIENPAASNRISILFGRCGNEAENPAEAEDAFAKYLQTSKDPAGKRRFYSRWVQ